MLVQLYSALKTAWSGVNDLIMGATPRRPVPRFYTPGEAAFYLISRAKYTGDPLGGAADFYLHPERLQAALEAGDFSRLSVDCDDYATWAYAALRQIPGCRPQIYTLLDVGPGSHVICGYELAGSFGAIDTNGHRSLPNLTPRTLCDTWSAIYRDRGYHYITAEPTPYPFT